MLITNLVIPANGHWCRKNFTYPTWFVVREGEAFFRQHFDSKKTLWID